MNIYALCKKRWVSKIVLTVVLVLWMLILSFTSQATWMAVLQNWFASFSDDYHTLKVENPRPLHEIEKVFLFFELIYLWFVAWFVCKRTVFLGQLDNIREHRRYWAGLGVTLFLLGCGFRQTFWGMWVGTLMMATGVLMLCSYKTKPYSYIVDGTVTRSVDEVERYYQRLKPVDDPGIRWGGMVLPTKEAKTNFMVIGSVGSGKTVTISQTMDSVLPTIRNCHGSDGNSTRAIVYDFKGEMPSLIAGITPDAAVHYLNPLDERTSAWDMAADITTDMHAETAAVILFPDPPGGQSRDQFFLEAARKCVKAVIMFLNDTAPKAWIFHDLVYILLSKERLMRVLGYSERTCHNLDYFAADRQAAAVMGTIKAKLEVYIPIAALWKRATKKISLREWSNSSSILVLGHDPENTASLRAINSLIFDRAAQILLKKENVELPHTYIFLDELGTLSRLGMLEQLAKTGRSKGVVLVVGFQSIDDLYGLYGKEQANVIISQFMNKAILRLSDETTSKWAENLIGQEERLRMTRHRSYPDFWSMLTGWDIWANHSDNETYTVKSAVLASEFREILPINKEMNQGLTGWYIGHYVYKNYIPFRQLIEGLPQRSPHVKDRCDAPDHWQRFESWRMADLQRLNLIQHQELLPQVDTPPLPEDTQEPVNWEQESKRIFEQFEELLEEDNDNEDKEDDEPDAAAA